MGPFGYIHDSCHEHKTKYNETTNSSLYKSEWNTMKQLAAMSTKRNLAEEAETMERRLIAADKLIGGLGTITLDCMLYAACC